MKENNNSSYDNTYLYLFGNHELLNFCVAFDNKDTTAAIVVTGHSFF